MKFSLIKISQRFSYKGQNYTKSGPLQAVPDGSGNQKMIPRSAVVTLLDDEKKSTTTKPKDLRQAIEAYHQHCLSLVSDNEKPGLEMRYQAIVKKLG